MVSLALQVQRGAYHRAVGHEPGGCLNRSLFTIDFLLRGSGGSWSARVVAAEISASVAERVAPQAVAPAKSEPKKESAAPEAAAEVAAVPINRGLVRRGLPKRQAWCRRLSPPVNIFKLIFFIELESSQKCFKHVFGMRA